MKLLGLQKHQSSIIYSFIFIHSGQHEIGTNVQLYVAFIRNEVGRVHLDFFQTRDFKVSYPKC